MDPRLSVSALCYYTTPMPEFLRRLTSMGIRTSTLLADAVVATGVEATRRLLDENGVAVPALVAGLPADLSDESTWADKRAILIRTVDAAADLGVPAVYTVTGALVDDIDTSVAAFGRYIEPVVAHAEERGVRFLIEPATADYAYVSFTHTLETALRVAKSSRVGLCLDIYHVWDDPDLETLLREEIDLVGVAQIGDSQRDANGVLQKQIPGDGDVPVADLVARIVAAGYTGAFDLEIDGPFIESIGVDESIDRAVAYMADALAAAPVGSAR